MTYYFNPSYQNYLDLRKLFEKLGIDCSISWDDAQNEDGSYMYDIFISVWDMKNDSKETD